MKQREIKERERSLAKPFLFPPTSHGSHTYTHTRVLRVGQEQGRTREKEGEKGRGKKRKVILTLTSSSLWCFLALPSKYSLDQADNSY